MQLTFFGLVVVLAIFHISCKKIANDRVFIADDTPRVEVEKSASATREVRATESFYYSIWKTPMEKKYSNSVAEKKAVSSRIPYSGYWYPEKRRNYNGNEYNAAAKGGTHVGSPSPLEKYDRAFHGGQNKAVEWEIRNHTRSPNAEGANWAGHCNGFAAASLRHREPDQSVTRGGVTFTAREIKALLAEVHMSAKFYILGGNRCDGQREENKPIERGDRADAEVMGECEDVNPATFHLALTNWIGRQKHGLIMDRQLTDEVWNYPVYAYEIIEEQGLLSLDEVRNKGYWTSVPKPYRYNPIAQSFAYVKMAVTYSDMLSNGETLNVQKPVVRAYEYLLELNEFGEIIGGEWLNNSIRNHPDFIWVALEPILGSGDSKGANPHVDPETVIELWAESVGEDPRNPPLDIVEPVWRNNWGRFANYSLEIDGDQTGAVFLGKETKLQIRRKEAVVGNVELLVTLNDTVLRRLDLEGADSVDINFQTKPGIHRLGLQWKKAGQIVDSRYVRIHVIH